MSVEKCVFSPRKSRVIVMLTAVLGIRIRRIRMFLGLQDPYPDPLVTSTDPFRDSSITNKKPWFLLFCNFFMTSFSLKNDVIVPVIRIRMFLGLPDPHPDPLARSKDPRVRIRVHTKISRIPNTGWRLRISEDYALLVKVRTWTCCFKMSPFLFFFLWPNFPLGPDGATGGAGPHQPLHCKFAPQREGERPGDDVLAVRAGHLHQDPQGRQPTEQGCRLCQVR